MKEDEKHVLIQGAGGGKKQKSPPPPKEAPNTLQSASTAKVLDLLAYGPIKGVVGGAKGVYLDDTVVQNENGSFNFDGVKLSFRDGEPDQDIIEGFNEVSSIREINTELRYGVPISRTVTTRDATSVLVTVKLGGLLSRNTESGDTNPYEVPFSITVRKDGAAYDSISTSIQGKTTSAYERTYRLSLPSSDSSDVTVIVQRTNKESESQDIIDEISWSKLAEVVDVKHNYPGCALVGFEVDARLFGETLPSRKYLTDLSIVQIPSNYNPYTRQYTGLWDGSMKWDWTDNPAWCFYDLATHPVIGAGVAEVNKFALYEIGKYCDELVDDGFGGKEPRFTCNTIFSDTADAINALNTFASIFRGMAYWGSDTVEVVADMPGPVRRIISPSDVVDGAFEYSGTSLKERHSVVLVQWNDPLDSYDAKPEVVELPEAIAAFGYKETEVTAVACTSRGQARRLGLWMLYSEHFETQIVTFEVTVKNADLRPGDFIAVSDPYRAGARLAGKILEVDRVGQWLTLDALPSEVVVGWDLTVEGDDKSLTRAKITAVNAELNKVRFASLSPKVFVGAGFSLTSGIVENQQFRVISVTENDRHNYIISASEHHPGKYDYVEKGLKLPEIPTTTLPSGVLSPPSGLSGESYTKLVAGILHQNATISWVPSADPRATKSQLDGKGPKDIAYKTLYTGDGTSFDVENIDPGSWQFRVRAFSETFGMSAWHEKTIYLADGLQPIPPLSLIIVPQTFSVSITPVKQGYTVSEFEFWRSSVPLTQGFIESNAILLGNSSGTFYDDTVTFDTVYYYYVRAVNAYGKSAFVAGQTRTLADVEDILGAIASEANEGPLGQWFNQEIEKISGDGPGSVNERVDEISQGIDDKFIGIDGKVQDITDVSLPSLNTYILEMRESLENEIAKMAYILAYDPALSYVQGDVVRGGENGMRLYLAKVPVAPDNPPPNELLWEDIGTMFADTAYLVQQVQANTSKLVEIEGEITAVADDMRYMSAAMRPERADGEKADSLEGWRTKVDFIERVKLQASENEALGSYIRALEVHVEHGVLARIQTEEVVRASQTEALATQLTTLQATVTEDVAVALTQERSARIAGDEAIVSDVTQLQGRMENAEGNILTEQQVRLSADEALASDVSLLSVGLSDESAERKSAILSEQTARVDGDTANTNYTNQQIAQVNTNLKSYTDGKVNTEVTDRKAAILSEQTARVQGDTASTNYTNQQISSLKTTVNGYTDTKVAAVQTDVNTKTGPTGALAQSISTLQTAVSGHTSSIQILSQTTYGIRDGLSSMWGVKLVHNSATGKQEVAGVGLSLTSGSAPQSEFIVRADRFVILNNTGGAPVSPFTIVNGKTIIRSALIGDATITNAKIVNATIETAKIKDAAITTAKIGALAVDTLQIAGRAVTIPVISSTAGELMWNTTPQAWKEIQRVTVNSTGQVAVITASAEFYTNFDPVWFKARIRRGGTADLVLWESKPAVGFHCDQFWSELFTLSVADTPPAGSNTYIFEVLRDRQLFNQGRAANRTLVYMELKR